MESGVPAAACSDWLDPTGKATEGGEAGTPKYACTDRQRRERASSSTLRSNVMICPRMATSSRDSSSVTMGTPEFLTANRSDGGRPDPYSKRARKAKGSSPQDHRP